MCYNFVLLKQTITTSLMEAKVEQKRIKFKLYDQNQAVRLPIMIENLIPINDLVRIVDRIIESIDLSTLESYYVASGRPPYHPKMMLKIWVYGYCQKIYTSRQLSKALRSNFYFIWLSANQQPCFKTLSGFRSGKMRKFLDDVFKVLLETLVEEGYINIDDLYVDGSKWEANANQYKVVWKKNTLRHKENAIKRIEGFLEEVKELQQAEDNRYGEKDLEEVGEDKLFEVVISSKEIQASIERINELASQTPTKSVKKNLESLKGKIAKEQEKVKKYEAQEAVLGSRNSYSKTDHDAVAMRMKDNRLRAAYNVQHSTNNL
jgi:transposase